MAENLRQLGSLISSRASLDAEISACIEKVATVMSKLNSRVWENKSLSLQTKLKAHQACVLSSILYGSET